MHMAGELFGLQSGTKLVHVPYKGSAAALQDLLGGQIDGMFGDLLVVSEYIKTGKLRALGVTSKKRHPMLPATPRSEEHTSELQSLMRTSYAVFCLNKKN